MASNVENTVSVAFLFSLTIIWYLLAAWGVQYLVHEFTSLTPTYWESLVAVFVCRWLFKGNKGSTGETGVAGANG